MLELVTGGVLAVSAGLNAYIPLLVLGLLSRFTELVQLPAGWAWLENEWTLGIVGVLLVIEILVDKFPVLDTANDVLHTVIRPASGGLVFSAGSQSDTVAVADPVQWVQSGQVWPFVLGVVIALIPHVLKAVARPILNTVTAGLAAPVTSTLEDIGAVLLAVLAVVVPVLALVCVVLLMWWLVRRLRRALRERAARRASAAIV